MTIVKTLCKLFIKDFIKSFDKNTFVLSLKVTIGSGVAVYSKNVRIT